MVMKNVMLATEAGLGRGETPIFPIQIFRIKEGINYNPGDPNYDLFKLALAFRARGGARGQFLEAAAAQAARAYGVMEDAEAAPRPVQKRKTAGASSSAGAGKAVATQ